MPGDNCVAPHFTRKREYLTPNEVIYKCRQPRHDCCLGLKIICIIVIFIRQTRIDLLANGAPVWIASLWYVTTCESQPPIG